MPLRTAYTEAAAPAGPPPTTSTSNGSLPAIAAALRAAAPVSSLARISSTEVRPELNGSPSRKTVGTAMIWRRSTSSWNRAPSMATCSMFGLMTLITLSAWTTSGQFWHDSDMYVSKR